MIPAPSLLGLAEISKDHKLANPLLQVCAAHVPWHECDMEAPWLFCFIKLLPMLCAREYEAVIDNDFVANTAPDYTATVNDAPTVWVISLLSVSRVSVCTSIPSCQV